VPHEEQFGDAAHFSLVFSRIGGRIQLSGNALFSGTGDKNLLVFKTFRGIAIVAEAVRAI
jgi:hypothetical protein